MAGEMWDKDGVSPACSMSSKPQMVPQSASSIALSASPPLGAGRKQGTHIAAFHTVPVHWRGLVPLKGPGRPGKRLLQHTVAAFKGREESAGPVSQEKVGRWHGCNASKECYCFMSFCEHFSMGFRPYLHSKKLLF